MKKKLVMLGGRGVGMIASTIIDKLGEYELLGFLNDIVPVGERVGRFKKIVVIGTSEDIFSFLNDQETYFFIAYLGMLEKSNVHDKLKKLNIPPDRLVNLIDPSAVIPYGYCSLGRGILGAPLVQLSPDTVIRDNCTLLPNSFVGHDSTIDEFVSIANNATVGGNVHVKRGVHIGTNATIRENIEIGEFSVVGMGSVVLNDVPPRSVVAGNPANIIRKID
jgi:acetyltransferase EpsM